MKHKLSLWEKTQIAPRNLTGTEESIVDIDFTSTADSPDSTDADSNDANSSGTATDPDPY